MRKLAVRPKWKPGDCCYHQLACGILHRAMKDWWGMELMYDKLPTSQGVTRPIQQAHALGFWTPAEALITFFESDWCEFLCTSVGVDFDSYFDRVRAGPVSELWEQSGDLSG